jgi:hypothetical protein
MTREAEGPEARSTIRHQSRQERTQRIAGQMIADLGGAMQHEQQGEQPQ